jgi:hypothetical protein
VSRKGLDSAWTDPELEVVRTHYPTLPVAEVAALLPGRTVEAVRHAAKRVGVKCARSWSPADDEVLRASWGKVNTGALAKRLGRSPSALKQRAGRLTLDAERCYTDAEKQVVRDLYATHTAAQIAERVHGNARCALAIYRLAAKLGLRKCAHWSPEEMARVGAAVAQGGTDAAVAVRLNLTREQVTHIRNRLKLPRNDADVLEARRGAVRTQYAALGVKNGGELRALAYRNFARANGWPEDLPPRAVQILNVLAGRGPTTRRQLAEAIGMPTDQVGRNGYPMYLKASAHSSTMRGHGSYTSLLLALNLITELRRAGGPGSGKQGARLPSLYSLTPEAIAHHQEHCHVGDERDQAGVLAAAAVGRAGADPGAGDRPLGGRDDERGPRRPPGRGHHRDRGQAGREGEGR